MVDQEGMESKRNPRIRLSFSSFQMERFAMGKILFVFVFTSLVSSLISPSNQTRQIWIPYFPLLAYPTLR